MPVDSDQTGQSVQQATGATLPPYAALVLASWRGHQEEVGDLIETRLDEVVARGEAIGLLIAQWAKAVLANAQNPLPSTSTQKSPNEARSVEQSASAVHVLAVQRLDWAMQLKS